MEGGIQLWPLLPHGFSPDGVGRLQEGFSPRCDRELASGFDHTPEFSYQIVHAGNKEHAKDTDDCVEVAVWKAELCHITDTEFHVLEPTFRRFGPRPFEKLLRQVNAHDSSARTDD